MCRVESEDLAPGVEREAWRMERRTESAGARQDAHLGAAGRGARC